MSFRLVGNLTRALRLACVHVAAYNECVECIDGIECILRSFEVQLYGHADDSQPAR
jgi:hypothetical protein